MFSEKGQLTLDRCGRADFARTLLRPQLRARCEVSVCDLVRAVSIRALLPLDMGVVAEPTTSRQPSIMQKRIYIRWWARE